jgi:glycine cleavage system transcriptional repressor
MKMENWIAVTAVGRDRPGIVAGVTEALLHLGCNLGETSMTRLRGEFAMILLVRLPPAATFHEAREALEGVGQKMDLTVTIRELSVEEARAAKNGGVGYILRVYGADRPGIVHAVTSLLAREGFNITDLETRVIPGESGAVYVMVLELDAPSEERGEGARVALQALAAEMTVEVSYDRLDQETM